LNKFYPHQIIMAALNSLACHTYNIYGYYYSHYYNLISVALISFCLQFAPIPCIRLSQLFGLNCHSVLLFSG